MRFVDLFCCAGGMTHGLVLAGHEHIAGVEIDPVVADAYAQNHGTVVCRDIADVSADELSDLAGPQGIDLIAASPPCQSFSMMRDDHTSASPSDLLFRHAIRLAAGVHARVIVMENVPAMAHKRLTQLPGAPRALDQILDEMRDAGFAHQRWGVLKAEEYGVPQKRRRLFIVAAREAADCPTIWPPPPPAGQQEGATPLSLRHHMEQGITRATHPHLYLSDRIVRCILAMRARYGRETGRCRVLKLDAVAPTVIANCWTNSGWGMIQCNTDGSLCSDGNHNGQICYRKLSVTEAKRLQSFPDDYIVPTAGARSKPYSCIGNAVPPLLAKAVGECIRGAARLGITVNH